MPGTQALHAANTFDSHSGQHSMYCHDGDNLKKGKLEVFIVSSTSGSAAVVQIMMDDNTSVTQTDPRWQDCQVASHEQFQSGQGHGARTGSPALGVMLVENQRDIMIINRHQQHPSTKQYHIIFSICLPYLDNCSMAKVLQFFSGENANREAGEW